MCKRTNWFVAVPVALASMAFAFVVLFPAALSWASKTTFGDITIFPEDIYGG